MDKRRGRVYKYWRAADTKKVFPDYSFIFQPDIAVITGMVVGKGTVNRLYSGE